MSKYDNNFNKYLSLQPFWDHLKSKITPFYGQSRDNPVAVAFELRSGDKLGRPIMESVPGKGLIGMSFLINDKNPQALCYGVLEDGPEDISWKPHGGKAQSAFMCQFFPGEFTRIFGLPSHELPSGGVALDEIFHTGSLLEEMQEANTFEGCLALMRKFVIHWENRTKAHKSGKLGQGLIASILENNGNMRIKELEEDTGYSTRYLQKIMLEQVGLTPKTLASNIRFQAILRVILTHPSWPLAQIAQETGFYDQSHFSKFFKERCGMSPTGFINRLNDEGNYQ